MKFLKKDTVSSLVLVLVFSVAFSALVAAGGLGKGAEQAGGESTLQHKMEQSAQRLQHGKQIGVGGTGKGGMPGEYEQAHTRGQVR